MQNSKRIFALMEQFAKAYTPWVEVIKPAKLRKDMIKILSEGLEKYKE